jgi:hypothetical protein
MVIIKNFVMNTHKSHTEASEGKQALQVLARNKFLLEDLHSLHITYIMSFLAQHSALSVSSEWPQSQATDHVTCSKGRKQHISNHVTDDILISSYIIYVVTSFRL